MMVAAVDVWGKINDKNKLYEEVEDNNVRVGDSEAIWKK